MATEIDRTTSLQALADSTGLIYDRAVFPEKVIGQAWLISRGRVVTLASSISNYADAPWALIVRFPHPNLAFAVRTVTIHPDFNRREARDYYLAQGKGPLPPATFENDLATLALESDVSLPEPEKIAELNRALSLPLNISPQDMSGSMNGQDILNILQSALSTGRSGLLTMADQRNIPFARISIRQTRIVRAQFENLHNEIAMCELIWRKPSGNFTFQPVENYYWPADLAEIATPTENIIAEAMRRADELPKVVEMLGGGEARFARMTKLFDINSIQPADRWVAERVWEVLDGYLTLEKVAERAGTDTYSSIKMIWDFATAGLIQVNQNQVFHCNGQLGPLLLPAPELDISTWDQLTAMYVDPYSGGPSALNGNFFGSAHVINNRTLLHTIPMPYNVQSAAVFKEGKLVGIHCGPAPLRGGNLPIALQRMVWIGALNELGTKRLRNTEAAAEAGEFGADEGEEGENSAPRLQNLRNRPLTAETVKAVVQPTMPVEPETGPLARFSKGQIAGGGALMFAAGLVMMLGSMFSSPSAPPANQPPAEKPAETAKAPEPAPTPANLTMEEKFGDLAAKEIAEKLAGFSGDLQGTFKYVDTSKLTAPRESFALKSEPKNTEIIFIYWPNIAPVQNLSIVNGRVPVFGGVLMDKKVDFARNTPHTNWTAGRYFDEEGKLNLHVIGTCPAKDPQRCFVWVARGAAEKTNLPDIFYPAQVIEQMLSNKGAVQPGQTESSEKPAAANVATNEQVEGYCKKIAGIIKSNYKSPFGEDNNADSLVGMELSVDESGAVSNMVIKPNPDEAVNKAFQKAINTSMPFPGAPHVKGGKLELFIQAEGDEISVIQR